MSQSTCITHCILCFITWLLLLPFSILIHIYGRVEQFNAEEISNEFNERIEDVYDDPNDPYVVGYPDQTDRIALNLSASYEFTNILHPGGESSDGVDPTQYAVFIGSYGCKHIIYTTYYMYIYHTNVHVHVYVANVHVYNSYHVNAHVHVYVANVHVYLSCQCICTLICCECTCISIMLMHMYMYM